MNPFPLDKKDLIELFNEFINEQNLVNEFENTLLEKGYSLDEYDELINNL